MEKKNLNMHYPLMQSFVIIINMFSVDQLKVNQEIKGTWKRLEINIFIFIFHV